MPVDMHTRISDLPIDEVASQDTVTGRAIIETAPASGGVGDTPTDLFFKGQLQITKRFDQSSQPGTTYIGSAVRGTAESAVGWTLKRIDQPTPGNRRLMITTKDTETWSGRVASAYA